MRDKTVVKRKIRERRKKHIRKNLNGTAEKPRLVVFRSLKHIYAQLVDDQAQRTLLTTSSLAKTVREVLKPKTPKKDVAKLVGKDMATKAIDMKIENVVFDRGGYLYHGRIKSLAEGAREGGLKF